MWLLSALVCGAALLPVAHAEQLQHEIARRPRECVDMLWDALRAQAQSNLAAKGLVLDPARKNIAVTGITCAGKSSLIKALLINLGSKCEWAGMGTLRAGMGVACGGVCE